MAGTSGQGFDTDMLALYANEIKMAVESGTQVAIVLGGGNIFRGLKGNNIGTDRVQGDYMGMLATVINSLALQSALQSVGVKSKVLSGLAVDPIAERVSGVIARTGAGGSLISSSLLSKRVMIGDAIASPVTTEANMT